MSERKLPRISHEFELMVNYMEINVWTRITTNYTRIRIDGQLYGN